MLVPIRRALLVVGFLAAVSGSVLAETQNPDIAAFETQILELSFSEAGVVQTSDTSHLGERMEEYNSPGVCVTVVENSSTLWTKGYGVLRADRSDAVTDQTLFQAGSVSKTVTALIVLHYVDRGWLDLDEDIHTYLTSWRMPANGHGTVVTLRQLLTHQSGIPGSNLGRTSTSELPTLPQILSGESPATNPPAVPTVAPGSEWAYSNLGYVLIQLILEDVCKMSLNEIATEVVFEPLGMDSSTFNYPLPLTWQSREAWPHEDGIPLPAVQDSQARAQGGLLTTTHDMALLAIEIMSAYHGTSSVVISQQMARQMVAKQAAIPLEAYGIPFDMGLGVLLDSTGISLSFLHPGQSYPGSAFLLVAFPETQQAVAMGVTGDRGDQLELEILATLAELYQWPSGQYFR